MDQNIQDDLNALQRYTNDIPNLSHQIDIARWQLSETLLRQRHMLTTVPAPSLDELIRDKGLRDRITHVLNADWFEQAPIITPRILEWLIGLPNLSCEIVSAMGRKPFTRLSLHLSQDHDEDRIMDELNQIVSMVNLVKTSQQDYIRINITSPDHQARRSFSLDRDVDLKGIARSTAQPS